MTPSKLLKFIMQLGLIFAQVLGLWPFRYDRKSQCFYTTKILRGYAAVVVPCLFFAYIFSIKVITINHDRRVHIPSSIGRFTTVFLSVQAISVYVITSVNQIRNYSSINEWLKKAQSLTKRIHSFEEGSELPFLRPVVYYIVNVLLINALNVYASVGILSYLVSVSIWKYLAIVFFILPNVSITIIPNFFYGLMLTITYYYRLLNHHLGNVMQELHYINLKPRKGAISSNKRKYLYMKQSCHLSDKIDQLAMLHEEVTACSIIINRIFSVQLLFYITYQICIFISKLFIIFIVFEFGLKKLQSNQFDYAILWYNVMVLAVTFWTTSVLSHSCHSTMEESNKTGDILQSILLDNSIDDRLRRSVEAFSMQLRHNKLNLYICGLYLMDHTILHSIIASAITYALILIQFELAEMK